MAREDNLTPFNKMSKERHEEISRKGREAAARKRTREKTMKELLKLMLSNRAPERWRTGLAELGMDPDDMSNLAAVLMGLLEAACSGDVKAVREIRSIMGMQLETPLEAKERKARIERLKAETEAAKARGGVTDEDETGVLILPEVLPEENADG